VKSPARGIKTDLLEGAWTSASATQCVRERESERKWEGEEEEEKESVYHTRQPREEKDGEEFSKGTHEETSP